MKHGIVYVLTNSVNGKQYVGLTTYTLRKRWLEHVIQSRIKETYLYKAMRKYGQDAFEHQIVACALDKSNLSELEREVIKQLKPAYNQTNGGEVTFGRKYDDVIKEQIRQSNTGKKRSAETCKRIGESKKLQYDNDPEFREKVLAALAKGRANPIGKAKRIAITSELARNRIWTEESRAKLSASCMGRKYGKEVIDRMKESKKRKIRCNTTGEIFSCRVEAAEKCKVGARSIWAVCNGERSAVRGLVFSYVI